MAILLDQNNMVFSLETKHTTYQMKVDPFGFLLHTYYGEKIQNDVSYLIVHQDRGFSGNPYDANGDRTYSLDVLPQEYPFHGSGDFRNTTIDVMDKNHTSGCDLRVDSYEIVQGKYPLNGLPAVYDESNKAMTLFIHLVDRRLQLHVKLCYGVFEEEDIITRAVQITNEGHEPIVLSKALSANLDFLSGNFDLIHFHGRHAGERTMERTHIEHGAFSIGSRRGTSSHQHNPFVILAERDTTEQFGNCYGMSFVYSGNFECTAEQDQYGQTRLSMGILSERFHYELQPKEHFVAPEVILCYSKYGLSDLSHKYHYIIRNHVCRGKYKYSRRPILINNWEATYFDFDGEKLFQIAKQASQLGVEMMVLDDGWFGTRNSDNESLGDWWVNEKKLPGGLGLLSKEINDLGMEFGLWIEPEMVSEDSQLYREHPDWVLNPNGRPYVRGRCQLVLDYTREEVRDYIFQSLQKLLDNSKVAYLKWDMNRVLTQVWSAALPSERQGEVYHRYVLGVYELLERFRKANPHTLIEGCSGGGGRFDMGMLYYTPQIWCSDNTDAIDRLTIQYGTSFAYPPATMGAHVSAVPNEQTGRSVPLETRGTVALSGTFGYEMDLGALSEEEKATVRQQIQDYQESYSLIQTGDYYRLSAPSADGAPTAWLHVSPDQQTALLCLVSGQVHAAPPFRRVKLRGLDPARQYRVTGDDRLWPGDVLMQAGYPLPMLREYQSLRLWLKAE